MFTTYYHRKFTGYNIYFKDTERSFLKIKSVQFLNKIGNIDIEEQDIYADGKIVAAFKVDQFEKGYYRVYSAKGAFFTQNIVLKSSIIDLSA